MRGGELDEEGRAGWEEGKKYQGADQKRDIQAAHKWLDEQAWQDVCMEVEKGKNGNRPITRTWTEDFMLRNNESREHIGTWLSNRGRGDGDSCKSMHTASHVGHNYSRWGKEQTTNANCASRPEPSEGTRKEQR